MSSTLGTASSVHRDRLSLPLKVFGLYNLIVGALLVIVAATSGTTLALNGVELFAERVDALLNIELNAAQAAFVLVAGGLQVAFGVLALKDERRHVAQLSYALIALTVLEIVLEIMLRGIGTNLISAGVRLAVLVVIASTVDPTLVAERRAARRLREEELEEEAREGTLGRAKGDRGFIELDFFNLFWVFVVCSFLGLVIETVFHMVVVDPGVYQDRAGLLFGPFSPIYGCGAVLMTVALNRFWRASPVVIFLVAAVIGGLFEAAVSWFMQVAFGAVAWDYSGSTILGLFPDPIAIIMGGRTSTEFMCMWGVLGLFWIKLCLPWLLKLINLIPWKMRYSVTAVCAILMLVNCVMTLQSLDFWYQRESGIQPSSPVEEFYAKNFDNAYMANRFQSMTITPDSSARAA